MKYLFYQSSVLLYSYMGVLMDEAIELGKQGHDIYFVTCNGCLTSCFRNMEDRKSQCIICKIATKKALSLLPKTVKVVDLKLYWPHHINEVYTYYNAGDIKKIKYKNVNIGFSVLSSYISTTRNMNPLINETSRIYFDNLISNACGLTDAVQSLYEDIKPDKVCLFNGRLIETRAVYDSAMFMGIETIVYEVKGGYGEPFFKTVFENSTPHSIEANWKVCEKMWRNDNLSEEEKIEIGKSFFEKRRNGIPSRDKIYTKNQKKGKLPPDWDDNKINISIFNSSEDEFSSIGDEFEKLAVFGSQFEGIEYILSVMNDEPSYHFYLRIHPNLANIQFKYHTDLFLLPKKYKNLTVISGSEDISSYDLMDFSDKVVVFGSTIGAEAAYWGKPVLQLAGSFYYYADVCYNIKDKSEIKKCLKAKLESKSRMGAIKYGYYVLNSNQRNQFKIIDFNWEVFHFMGKRFMDIHFLKILGSSKFYAIYLALIHMLFKFMDKPNHIPRTEM